MPSPETIPAPDAPAAENRPAFPPALLERVGFLLSMVKGGAEGICQAALAPLELHVKQFGLLTVLATEGAHSQQEIAEWIRLDRTTMVALVDSLEARGLARRERNPDDRRAYLLQITPKGRRIHRRAEEVMAKAERRLLSSLDEGEREQLLSLLSKVAIDIGRPPAEPRLADKLP
jgi:DNA-binding MarR family transcriptional regulator